MIISKTPFRVSFFGGGTDYPDWFYKYGGAVVSTTINKYCYISVRELPPFFEHNHRIVYSKVELVNDIDAIEHPVVRAVLKDKGIENGIEIHHFGDLPARSGLGSSSSFTVGLLNAIYALQGRMVPKETLAKEAIRVEHDLINENVGWQDQVNAAFGGLNRIEFTSSGQFVVSPVIIPPHRIRELENSIMLFFSGFSRLASEIAKETMANIGRRESELNTLKSMVDESISILQDERRPLTDFGRLMHESWTLKRRLASNVSNPEIDAIYEAALSAGATGGKLMGAGGGGFFIFIVEPHRRREMLEKLRNLIYVSCRLDFGGTEITMFTPNNDSASATP